FLKTLINEDEVADSGSVLINHPRQQKLVLFNENNFLFDEEMLEPVPGKWMKEFPYARGIAGMAFEQAQTIHFSRGSSPKRLEQALMGDSPIQNMICIPIMTAQGPPFGVVCLHNNDPERKFSAEQIDNIQAFVDIFAIALHVPTPELHLERNVFIVHGRDEGALGELLLVLEKYGVRPKVLRDEEKNAVHILTALEDLLRDCTGGFILATPDDEGRLAGDRKFASRVRENVMFETGLLFAKFRSLNRVAILLKEPLDLPSDLNGVSFDKFTS